MYICIGMLPIRVNHVFDVHNISYMGLNYEVQTLFIQNYYHLKYITNSCYCMCFSSFLFSNALL